jgi:hypothetical protein
MIEIESNYFTMAEDHFRAARGTGMFLLSPLDLAMVEAWKNGGIPIEAVLRGIDVTFEKWRKRPARGRTQMVNSISYCAQAIAVEAQAMADAAPTSRPGLAPPFSIEEVRAFVGRNAAALGEAGHYDLANSLDGLDIDVLYNDCEKLEQELMQVEEALIRRLRTAESEEMLFEARRALDRELKPYRGKMTTEQLDMLEKQFLDRRLLESAGLPRLSLFYL